MKLAKQGKSEDVGYPKFKKRGQGSFTVSQNIKIEEGRIRVPYIGRQKQSELKRQGLNQAQVEALSWIRLKQKGYIPVDGDPGAVTISERGGKYFLSVQMDRDVEPGHFDEKSYVGVDVGIKSMLVTASHRFDSAACDYVKLPGKSYDSPRKYRTLAKRMKRLQRKISRQVKGSKSRSRTKLAIGRLHYAISCHRSDAIHKATTEIVKAMPEQNVVIEDLATSNMVKNHNLASSILNSSFFELRRQLTYKCDWYGKDLVVADRFYPSSKRCSACGSVKTALSLAERTYECECCGHEEDRDSNAASNLAQFPRLQEKTEEAIAS